MLNCRGLKPGWSAWSMSACQRLHSPHFLSSVSCTVQFQGRNYLCGHLRPRKKKKKKSCNALIDGWIQIGGSDCPSDLYVFRGKFAGGIRLIWYLLPLTLSQAFTSYLVRNAARLKSLPLQRRTLMADVYGRAPPHSPPPPTSPHLAGLTTYGKPIRDCIGYDLLSPVPVLNFIIWTLPAHRRDPFGTRYESEVSVWSHEHWSGI